MTDASAFSPDYTAAQARFRSGALALGWHLERHPIGEKGPDGTELTIDVARYGDDKPRRAVVVSSGLHGVEGFFGSAVQCAMLEDVLGGWTPADGTSLIFLHALNPYGFAWLRRVNENNVDLNRNFLLGGEPFSGSPPKYGDLDPLLNPAKPPGTMPLFMARAIFNILRHGMPALKNAVAGGQYDYPKGLFFGGPGPQQTQTILQEQLPGWVGSAERVIHIDFHTGLGASGSYKLLIDHPWDSPMVAELGGAFGTDVVEPWEPSRGVSYAIRGGLGTWCKALLPDTHYDVAVAEFGTHHVLKVIEALHRENCAHHWASPDDKSTQEAKGRLLEIFAPRSKSWRDTVVPKGIRIVQQAIDAL